jgi:hypothetical protein
MEYHEYCGTYPIRLKEKIKGKLQTPQVMEFPVTEIHRKALKT